MWLLVIFIFFLIISLPSFGGLVLTMCLRLSSNLCQFPDFSPLNAGVMTMLGLKRGMYLRHFFLHVCDVCMVCMEVQGSPCPCIHMQRQEEYMCLALLLSTSFLSDKVTEMETCHFDWADQPVSSRDTPVFTDAHVNRHMKSWLAFNMTTGFLIQVLIFAHRVLLHT